MTFFIYMTNTNIHIGTQSLQKNHRIYTDNPRIDSDEE